MKAYAIITGAILLLISGLMVAEFARGKESLEPAMGLVEDASGVVLEPVDSNTTGLSLSKSPSDYAQYIVWAGWNVEVKVNSKGGGPNNYSSWQIVLDKSPRAIIRDHEPTGDDITWTPDFKNKFKDILQVIPVVVESRKVSRKKVSAESADDKPAIE